jgi:hypothetical protein
MVMDYLSVPEVYSLTLELGTALGVRAISEMSRGWIHRIDSNWTVVLNGTPLTIEAEPEGGMKARLEPFDLGVWWNGWLAGIVTPNGGVLAAHPDGANEETLIVALRRSLGEVVTDAQD